MAQDGFNFHHETKRDTDLFLCIMLILINLISRNTLTRNVYPQSQQIQTAVQDAFRLYDETLLCAALFQRVESIKNSTGIPRN